MALLGRMIFLFPFLTSLLFANSLKPTIVVNGCEVVIGSLLEEFPNHIAIPVAEVPATAENYLRLGYLVNIYFQHAKNELHERVDVYNVSNERGMVPVERAVAAMNTKSHRKSMRKTLESHGGLRVFVNRDFEEVLNFVADTPHASPIWVKDENGRLQVAGFEKAELQDENGNTYKATTYHRSTWIRDTQKKVFRELHEAGLMHAIGVYRIDPNDKTRFELVAGSLFQSLPGNFLSVAAASKKKILRELPEANAEALRVDLYPERMRLEVEPEVDNAGHIEELATILLAMHAGFEYLDIGLAIKGLGFEKYNGENIPSAKFLEIVNAQISKADLSPWLAPNTEITDMLREFSAPRAN